MDNSRNILEEGLQELGVVVTEHQIDQLLNFVVLIEKWNKTYNLTAIRNREEMLRLHILDSLALLPFVSGKKIADIGTGAGLPGIPLAIFLTEQTFTLVDSNSKKTRFVQQAIVELKLANVEVKHSRVEDLGYAEEYDAVLSRAFASLSDIMALAEYLLRPDGVLIAMKGVAPMDELKELGCPYVLDKIVVPGIDAERCVVRIKKT
ncbi:MAG: 16S rRNA (guanine(527)-N(7))-methyltransferase RsmG [Methyloprofundus sp.]|nr:16S rRNA (guanine(527)-N(7))-methyltransferase RsmG [Methyloprofundus sp.]